jgi:hypothetical protein
MTKKIFGALILVFAVVNIFSFGGGHDSLLFEGSGEVKLLQNSFGDGCNIYVTKVSGFVLGTKVKKEIYEVCGEWDTVYSTKSGVQLERGDNVSKNDVSVIVLGPNSTILIDQEMCETANAISKIRITAGSLWTKVKKLIGGGKFEVSTDRNGGGVRGTEFTFEITPEKEVIKVYEGTFEVYPLKKNLQLEDSGKEMEQLQKDFESGKISMDEYTAKMMEFSNKMSKLSDEITKSTMVEAGYMVTVTDKVSTPEPIPTGETKWFEDPRIK